MTQRRFQIFTSFIAGLCLVVFLQEPLVLAIEDAKAPSSIPEKEETQDASQQRLEKIRARREERRQKRRALRREKEVEGTKAPNRFEKGFNPKSQYKYRGKVLEIDTD